MAASLFFQLLVRIFSVLFMLVSFGTKLLFAVEKTPAFETIAEYALLLDYNTGTTLFERKADVPIPPASLVKLMTAALVFRELKEGRLKLDGEMVASTNAWRRGGAVSGAPNMLLTPNKIVKVGDLVTGLVVGGANDAAITLAENISGTEARFAQAMNDYAKAQGWNSLTFFNATGFAQERQVGSLKDYARLAAHLISQYPDYYPLFGQKDMPYGRNRQVNRNPLIGMDIGADGLMTGNLPEAGFHLVASSVQEGRRVILAMGGMETAQARALEARKLLEWAHRRFELRTLYPAGAIVGEVTLHGAAAWAVPVRIPADVRLPVLRGNTGDLNVRLVYQGPVAAPVKEGARLATLQVLLEGRVIQESPLEAAQNVGQGSVLARARDAVIALSRRWVLTGFEALLVKTGFRSPPNPADASTRSTVR
jgi:serine-type D-Ala-D-Ala carboxypeptidase (penicillin-binding protein 5/6)